MSRGNQYLNTLYKLYHDITFNTPQTMSMDIPPELVLGSGEINHIGPGEKSQYRPDENRQSRVASPPAVLFTRPVVGQPVSR